MLRHLSLLVLTPLVFSMPVAAAPDTPVGTCMSSDNGQLTCDLRAVVPATLNSVEHLSADMTQNLMVQPFDGTAAWSLVVDTTHEMPVGLITDDRYGGIRADIAAIIDQASDSRLIEVHAYDGTLETLVPFGSVGVATSLDALMPMNVDPADRSGFYLAGLTAIERLAALEADRKALVLFTDGLTGASDSSVQRLINAANDAGVTIIGMAYAGSEADLANHLELRVMASATQGTTVYPSMTNQRLNDDNMRGFFATLENGGTLELSASDMMVDEPILIRASYSDGRMMDGMLTLP